MPFKIRVSSPLALFPQIFPFSFPLTFRLPLVIKIAWQVNNNNNNNEAKEDLNKKKKYPAMPSIFISKFHFSICFPFFFYFSCYHGYAYHSLGDGRWAYSRIEKIKSTGATYMAASGLTESTCDPNGYQHVIDMLDYALELFQKITNVNEHSFNNFRMRIGINIGPVVAGVIGSRKPQYGE